MRPPRRSLPLLLLALAPAACSSPEPKDVLEIRDVETYWAVDSPVGERLYIAPVVRFTLVYKGQEPARSVQASAAFRRKGEETIDWGSDWRQVNAGKKPLQPGQKVLVVLKSDGRYYSSGSPETFFRHKLFKDAKAQVYLRVGASRWVLFAEPDVERRIGTKALEELPKPNEP